MKRDPESELRARWTAQGVPKDRQDAILAEVAAAAQPGAKVGPFVIGAEAPRPALAVPAFWKAPPIREGERVAERDLFGGVGDLPLFAVASYRTEGATI